MAKKCPECGWTELWHANACSKQRLHKVSAENDDPLTFALACACGQTFHGTRSEAWVQRAWALVHRSPKCYPTTVDGAAEVRRLAGKR